MSYQKIYEQQNEEMRERYILAMERIALIPEENSTQSPYREYFCRVADFLMNIKHTVTFVEEGKMKEWSMEELQKWNQTLYIEIEKEYETSYANPTYAVTTLGSKYGSLLCFLYTELRGVIAYSFEQRLFPITIGLELFIEVYNLFEEEEEDTIDSLKSAIYYYMSDYCDVTMAERIRERLDPEASFATEIIMESDLEDLRYLYQYGEYISENECKTAAYLNGLSEEAINSMAETYTQGFRMGFVNNRIDMSKKSVVNIHYFIGFERIIRAAIGQFEKMGLKPTIFRTAVSSIHKRQNLKNGFYATSPNKQYDYDHRFDDALYLDKAFIERKLTELRVAYEKYKDLAAVFAGPAVLEIFGEKNFQPVNKTENCQLSEKQQKLAVRYQGQSGIITNDYIKSEEYSFTIIAFPIPEIGKDFEAIFDETVKVNTLDMDVYRTIQQCMIDVLDQGEYVRILGTKPQNHTDLKVMLHPLTNPDQETKFENCLADVNIPVGEVFTSPVLTGTEGVLHVSEVFLNESRYMDLELSFQDGRIKDYTCKNFENETENKRFVKENLMFQHETLPLGEFAIGTNTTAYVMGRKFNISDKLPILIAEKTGPHFAVGDTCYRMSEDHRVYNPDGKEIIAKENEISALRKTDMEKAYFNCHTDITIPYSELDEISVYDAKGEKTVIIKNGRFVLPGTEQLNDVF
jgi:Leucyl aminopeptidase (aminopeptidase T)